MVWNISQLPMPGLAATSKVKRITNTQGVNDAIDVQEEVWQRSFDDFRKNLIERQQHDSDNISIYVAYENDKPVSSAWITYTPDSPFGGLWGGSTLEGYRGRGFYSDLIAARAHEAKARGIKYLTIDASDMSRPIVEKLGFEFISYTQPYEYDV